MNAHTLYRHAQTMAMPNEASPSIAENSLQRYAPLIIRVGAVLLAVVIPFQILGTGFIPGDDAMRHVAKVIADKPWSEILVLREGFALDHHEGWHTLLRALHEGLGLDQDQLMVFCVTGMFALVCFAMFSHVRRAEAMLAVLFVMSVAAPGTSGRWMFGRPFLLTTALAVFVLRLWLHTDKPSLLRMAATVALISLGAWAHGSWYLFGILVAAFVLAGQFRKGILLGLCWLLGSVLGAVYTGHPFLFLWQTTVHLFHTLGDHTLQRMLVIELRPEPGDLAAVAAVLLMLLWRMARGAWNKNALRNPLLALAFLGWLLGLKVGRFWTDWGFAGAILWLAGELQAVLDSEVNLKPLQQLLFAGFAAAGLFIATTRDLGGRWTADLTVEYLDPKNPDTAPWLPEPGGIVYNSDMQVFFRTFYKNPRAEWRYLLGFEPAIMPEEDLAMLRKIQWNWFAPKAYEPWVRKLRPQDRMILTRGAGDRPQIAELEWYYAATDTWIGRLPRNPR